MVMKVQSRSKVRREAARLPGPPHAIAEHGTSTCRASLAIWLLTPAIAVHCSIAQIVSLLQQKLPPPNGACIPLARTEK